MFCYFWHLPSIIDTLMLPPSEKTYSSFYIDYCIAKQGGETVGVQEVNEKYRCNICGNEVVVTKVGGGTLVCCGQDMELIS